MFRRKEEGAIDSTTPGSPSAAPAANGAAQPQVLFDKDGGDLSRHSQTHGISPQ